MAGFTARLAEAPAGLPEHWSYVCSRTPGVSHETFTSPLRIPRLQYIVLDKCDFTRKAIGSLYAAMTRTDAVVMTAGIGENSAELRERIFSGLAHMGMILDKEKNQVVGAIGTNRIVSIDDSPIKICVVTTDEEMRIARETDALVSEARA